MTQQQQLVQYQIQQTLSQYPALVQVIMTQQQQLVQYQIQQTLSQYPALVQVIMRCHCVVVLEQDTFILA